MAIQIQLRRGTSAEWILANPVIASGEMVLETDTGRFKVGNGVDKWAVLSYTGFVDQGNDPSNWDLNYKFGLYYVGRNSWSGTVGTPTQTTSTGILNVLTSGDMVLQKYQPSDVGTLNGAEFVRIKVGFGSWGPWTRTVAEGGLLDGGTF
jgi:hypothetical protein